MVHPTVLYLILSLVLLVIAVVVHVRSSNLSLAISPTLSIITILLPIVGFLNTSLYPSFSRATKSSSNRVAQLGPFIVQVLQALIATILATLLLERAAPSGLTSCMLEKQWMKVQVLGLLFSKNGSQWMGSWGNDNHRQTSQHRESRRPLLIDRERDIIEEEDGAFEQPERESQGYGGINENESGPRVVPSAVAERNNWVED
ncbi:hypothetical protein QYS62_001274 [Fusarium acuminatum]|uniref:Uncharacterized protein n=1 Tax=Fusarium acuminatum TaxID=5515 RepID=A0ABZ2WJW9_9HYPO